MRGWGYRTPRDGDPHLISCRDRHTDMETETETRQTQTQTQTHAQAQTNTDTDRYDTHHTHTYTYTNTNTTPTHTRQDMNNFTSAQICLVLVEPALLMQVKGTTGICLTDCLLALRLSLCSFSAVDHILALNRIAVDCILCILLLISRCSSETIVCGSLVASTQVCLSCTGK